MIKSVQYNFLFKKFHLPLEKIIYVLLISSISLIVFTNVILLLMLIEIPTDLYYLILVKSIISFIAFVLLLNFMKQYRYFNNNYLMYGFYAFIISIFSENIKFSAFILLNFNVQIIFIKIINFFGHTLFLSTFVLVFYYLMIYDTQEYSFYGLIPLFSFITTNIVFIFEDSLFVSYTIQFGENSYKILILNPPGNFFSLFLLIISLQVIIRLFNLYQRYKSINESKNSNFPILYLFLTTVTILILPMTFLGIDNLFERSKYFTFILEYYIIDISAIFGLFFVVLLLIKNKFTKTYIPHSIAWLIIFNNQDFPIYYKNYNNKIPMSIEEMSLLIGAVKVVNDSISEFFPTEKDKFIESVEFQGRELLIEKTFNYNLVINVEKISKKLKNQFRRLALDMSFNINDESVSVTDQFDYLLKMESIIEKYLNFL